MDNWVYRQPFDHRTRATLHVALFPAGVLPLEYDFLQADDAVIGDATVLGDDLTLVRSGSTASMVDDTGTIITKGANVPRFGRDRASPYGARGLLVEKDKDNFILRSEEADNASWSKLQLTISADDIVAPDGATTADKLVETTDDNVHLILQGWAGVAGNGYNFSVFLKKGTRDWAHITVLRKDNTAANVFFNISNGTVGSGALAAFAKVEAFDNGWYRCSVFASILTGGTTPQMRVGLASADGTISYTGSTSDHMHAWGMTVENVFETSYHKTTSSADTRSEDDVTVDVTGEDLSTGSMAATIEVIEDSGIILQLDDGTEDNRILLRRETGAHNDDKAISFVVTDGTVEQVNLDLGDVANLATITVRASWATNDFKALIIGQSQVVDTSGTVPSGLTTFRIGNNTSDQQPQGWFKAASLPAVLLEASISGDVTHILSNTAVLLEGREIVGAVTQILSNTAVLIQNINPSIAGAVTQILSNSAVLLEGRVIVGDVTQILSNTAVLVQNINPSIAGAITQILSNTAVLLEGREIAGAVTHILSNAAVLLEGREIVGDVTLILSNAAVLLEGREIAGDVTQILSNTAVFVQNINPSITGDVTHILSNAATLLEGREIAGAVTQILSNTAALVFTGDNEIVGDVTLILSNTAVLLEGRVISGAVTQILSNTAVLDYNRNADISGAVTQILSNAAVLLEGRVISGAVTQILSNTATLTFESANQIVGDVTLILSNVATMLEGRVIVGAVTQILSNTAVLAFAGENEIAGAVTHILSNAAVLLEGRQIAGAVPMALLNSATFEENIHPEITGDVTQVLLNSAVLLEGNVIVGSVILELLSSALMDSSTIFVAGNDIVWFIPTRDYVWGIPKQSDSWSIPEAAYVWDLNYEDY